MCKYINKYEMCNHTTHFMTIPDVPICLLMVPSGSIKEETPTGTITVKHTVSLCGGKNGKPRFRRKNKHYQKEIESYDPNTTLSAQNRPGSPVCGYPAAFRAVGRTGTSRNLRKTERGIDPINSRNER